nr:PREDICTED: vitelline membrane outer layer protein 1 homolog [Bos indicus]
MGSGWETAPSHPTSPARIFCGGQVTEHLAGKPLRPESGWRWVGGTAKPVRLRFLRRWGWWSEPLWCPVGGFLVAFSLRVEAPVTFGDNTAANNVRFLCSDGTELQGPGLTWGDFGNWSELCPKGICGLQTKIQQPQGLLDDTAINDALFFCCRN